MHDRHAKTGAAFLGREERLVDPRLDIWLHADTGILDPDRERVVRTGELDSDHTAGGHRLDGIADQVEDDLMKLGRVDAREQRLGRDVQRQARSTLRGGDGLEITHMTYDADHVVFVDVQLRRPREREEVVEQLGEPLDLGLRELARLEESRIVVLAAKAALEQLELQLGSVLIPRSSAALDVDPPVALSVSRIDLIRPPLASVVPVRLRYLARYPCTVFMCSRIGASPARFSWPSTRGISRVLLGSVAEKIVRHAKRPVLVARTRS